MKKAILRRQPNGVNATLGNLELYNNAGVIVTTLVTLELPWRNNKRNASCIPAGLYKVVKYVSNHFGECWHVRDVRDRSGILFHAGNHHTNTQGCILVGMYFENMDADRIIDIGSSRLALKVMNDHFEKEFELLIQ